MIAHPGRNNPLPAGRSFADMDNKRTYQRIEMEGMDIQCKMLYAPEVHVLDLSMGGGRLVSPKRLHIGAEYSFVLSCNGERHPLKGVVIREKLVSILKAENGDAIPQYEVGIRFEEVLSGDGQRLLAFIEAHAGQHEQRLRLMGTRTRLVDMQEKPPVSAQATKEYRVERIGMGGLQVRSTHRLRPGSKFRMEVMLSEDHPPMVFEGRVAYSHPEVDGSEFSVGIQFTDMNAGDRGRLESFIGTLGQGREG